MTEPSKSNDFSLDGDDQPHVLRLYVAGASSNSLRAIANIKRICDLYLSGHYSLEIIDVRQQKAIARQEQVVALPLLIKSSPLPQRRLIGDMSDTEQVLHGLGIRA